MKQHITKDQIEELSLKGKGAYKRLKKKYQWFDAEMVWLNYKVWFLNIGQMIEVLVDHKWVRSDVEIFTVGEYKPAFKWKGNLCDTLWQLTKEILERGRNETIYKNW